MLIKMKDILGFSSFYNEVKSQKLSMKVSYNIARLAKAIEQELEFYREKFSAIVQEYSDKDENGNPIPTDDGGIKIKPGFEHECYHAIDELQNLDVELPDVKFSIEDFGNVEIEPITVNLIIPFIKE